MPDFCYWEAKSLPDCLIVYLNALTTIAVAVLAVKYFRLTNRKLQKQVKIIYTGIWLWILTNFTKNIYGIIIYHSFITQGSFEAIHSKIFAILDTLPAIVVQTLLVVIPYIMLRNTMNILHRMKIQKTLQQLQFLHFYVFYLVIRFVILFFSWLALILVPLTHSSDANFVKLGMQLLDSLICNALLLISLSIFLKRFSQIKLDFDEDKKKLQWQYGLMVASSTFRFIFDLIFLIVLPLLEDNNSNCIDSFSDHLYFSLGYTFLGSIAMHFIPIGVILYAYKPNSQRNQEVSE